MWFRKLPGFRTVNFRYTHYYPERIEVEVGLQLSSSPSKRVEELQPANEHELSTVHNAVVAKTLMASGLKFRWATPSKRYTDLILFVEIDQDFYGSHFTNYEEWIAYKLVITTNGAIYHRPPS